MAGIRRCVSAACGAAMFKDRDVNAVFNIFAAWVWLAQLGAGAGRPPYLESGDLAAGARHRYAKLPVWVRPRGKRPRVQVAAPGAAPAAGGGAAGGGAGAPGGAAAAGAAGGAAAAGAAGGGAGGAAAAAAAAAAVNGR
jgi:hypothetical protein